MSAPSSSLSSHTEGSHPSSPLPPLAPSKSLPRTAPSSSHREGRGRGFQKGLPTPGSGRGGGRAFGSRRPPPSHASTGRRHRPRVKGGREEEERAHSDAPAEKRVRWETAATGEEENKREEMMTQAPVTEDTGASASPSSSSSSGQSVSQFAQLHANLHSPEAIALYLKDKERRETILGNSKMLQTFIAAALSGRPEEMWMEWTTNYKKDVHDLLFALYALATTPTNKASGSSRAGKGGQALLLRPSSHEFLIRLEKHGVRHSSWETSLNAAPYHVDTSLLSPKSMLKQLANLDPVARLERWIELSRTPEDLYKCGLKMKAYWNDELAKFQQQQQQQQEETKEAEQKKKEQKVRERGSLTSDAKTYRSDSCGMFASSLEEMGGGGGSREEARNSGRGGGEGKGRNGGAYESQCALLSKWVSKMRRVASSKVAVASEEHHEEKQEKEEGSKGNRVESTGEAKSGNDEISITATGTEEKEGGSGPPISGVEEANAEEVKKEHEDSIMGVARDTPQQTCYLCWSKPQRQLMRDAFAMATTLLGYIMEAHHVGKDGGVIAAHLRSPTGKLLRYSEWASPLRLVRKEDVEQLRAWEEVAHQSLSITVSQMEVVSRIKEVQLGDSESLRALLDELWVEEKREGNAAAGQRSLEEGKKRHKNRAMAEGEEEGWEKAEILPSPKGTSRVAIKGCFLPSSSDVLSSIATAVSNPKIDPSLQELTARRLVATQHTLRRKFFEHQREAAKASSEDSSSTRVGVSGMALHPPQLPRRALRLIENYAQQERQAVLKKRIDELKKENGEE